jgi:hypothetical protein
MGLGKAAGFDRGAAVRFGAAVERRLSGRAVRSLAIWLPEGLASSNNGLDVAALVELVVRGVVEGSHEPGMIYRATVDSKPPDLDQLTVVVSNGDRAALTRAAARAFWRSARATTSVRKCSRTRQHRSRGRTDCARRSWVPNRPRDWA